MDDNDGDSHDDIEESLGKIKIKDGWFEVVGSAREE